MYMYTYVFLYLFICSRGGYYRWVGFFGFSLVLWVRFGSVFRFVFIVVFVLRYYRGGILVLVSSFILCFGCTFMRVIRLLVGRVFSLVEVIGRVAVVRRKDGSVVGRFSLSFVVCVVVEGVLSSFRCVRWFRKVWCRFFSFRWIMRFFVRGLRIITFLDCSRFSRFDIF